jgi:hypothetical protein
MAAHPVGDHEETELAITEEAVLVVVPRLTDVRAGVQVQLSGHAAHGAITREHLRQRTGVGRLAESVVRAANEVRDQGLGVGD